MSATLAEALLNVAQHRTNGAIECLRHGARDRAIELISQAREALADAAREAGTPSSAPRSIDTP